MTLENQYILRSPKHPGEWEKVRQLLIDYRDEFNSDECFSSFEEEMAHIEQLYSRPGNVKIIAVSAQDGEIVGCVALQPFTDEIAEMKRLYVIPAHRGHQLGRLLTEKIITLAAESGFKHLYLDTMQEMVAAQRLYLSLGFNIISPYDNQDISRLICFGKTLNTPD